MFVTTPEVMFVTTPEMQQAQAEAMARDFQVQMERARQRQQAVEAWRKAHPPCPHCGRQDEPPIWLTMS